MTKINSTPSKTFDYSLDFTKVDFRVNPELYRVGKGEQGVLLVQPYKSEILPNWRFKTPEIAKESSEKIYELFLSYLDKGDFVGADMARKFLQMGYTRSRRYANHKSGRKYSTSKTKITTDKTNIQEITKEIQETNHKSYPYSSGSPFKQNSILPTEEDRFDNQKAKSAQIFQEKWQQAKTNPAYIRLKKEFEDQLNLN